MTLKVQCNISVKIPIYDIRLAFKRNIWPSSANYVIKKTFKLDNLEFYLSSSLNYTLSTLRLLIVQLVSPVTFVLVFMVFLYLSPFACHKRF